MALFRFSAVEAHSGRPVSVEIFLADHKHGYTPRHPGQSLEVHSDIDGPQPWYAMLRNARIAAGENDGGNFRIVIDDIHHEVTVESA